MNAADSARLELAKRAFQATQPSEREVQTGVRRARLSLRRARPRRTWLFKGLVFVVLALGSLAYAKPHALGELLERSLPARLGGAARGHGLASSADTTPSVAVSDPIAHPEAHGARPASETTSRAEPLAPVAAAPSAAHAATTSERRQPSKSKPVLERRAATPRAEPPTTPTATTESGREPRSEEAVSAWGRVGQALAQGDEAKALTALGQLADSPDPRTRDKADLGRAQLLMAHGSRDQACALARSLTQRRAGSQIERQAQALLSSCRR